MELAIDNVTATDLKLLIQYFYTGSMDHLIDPVACVSFDSFILFKNFFFDTFFSSIFSLRYFIFALFILILFNLFKTRLFFAASYFELNEENGFANLLLYLR